MKNEAQKLPARLKQIFLMLYFKDYRTDYQGSTEDDAYNLYIEIDGLKYLIQWIPAEGLYYLAIIEHSVRSETVLITANQQTLFMELAKRIHEQKRLTSIETVFAGGVI